MNLNCISRSFLCTSVLPKKYAIQLLCTAFGDSNTKNIKTAGIIVIGDEILRGDVADCNSQFIATEFRKIGIEVKKISIVSDALEDISREVKEFTKLYSFVITTGGMGPTHDDTAFAAVAHAFNESLTLNPNLLELCQKFFNTTDPNHPGMKLARIPKSAKLTYLPTSTVPQISIGNVYMFPGVPDLLQKWFRNCSALFPQQGTFFKRSIYVDLPEHEIADILSELDRESHHEVQIGSYPESFDKRFKVKVTIESRNEIATNTVYEKMLRMLPTNAIINCDS